MEEKEKKNKPGDADWKQQRLAAWQPLLTPQWVIGTLITVGIIFLAIGIALVLASSSVIEFSQRYDDISTCAVGSICNVTIPITSTMSPPIYVYYQLTNYYQNHRRYVSSISYPQLQGQLTSAISDCSPLETNASGVIIVPCGLIANSFFNDTFSGEVCSGSACTPLSSEDWSSNGIAWESDVQNVFVYVNPASEGLTDVAADGHVLPPVNNTDLMVWMRVAGLPSFRKLYRIINTATLSAGDDLVVTVNNSYPVSSFSGTKTIVVSTASWLGGKNSFLGWVYIAVAIATIVFGLVFLVIYLIKPRKPGALEYLDWVANAQEDDDPD
jgi:hypothetical protein